MLSTFFGRCSICTLSFEIDDVTSLKCGHTYHNECIGKWIQNAKNCPKCRTKNTMRDMIRLFIDEGDNTIVQSASESADSNVQLAAKLEKTDAKLKETLDAKMALELANKDLYRENNKLKEINNKQEEHYKRIFHSKDAQIEQLQWALSDQGQMQKQLEDTKRRLKACEFYKMVSKKHEDEAQVEAYIDRYSHTNGNPEVGEFLKAVRKQLKKAEEKNAELSGLLKQGQKDNARKDMELERLRAEMVDVQKELQEGRKRRVESTNGESPASSSHRRARPSMGFSFNEQKSPLAASRYTPLDDSDIQILTSPNSIPGPKTMRPPSCYIVEEKKRSDNSNKNQVQPMPFTFFDDQPTSSTTNNAFKKKEPYLSDDLSDIFSPKVLDGAMNSNVLK